VSHGQARAVIVSGQSPFYSFVAGELQKYIERFSGARGRDYLAPVDWGRVFGKTPEFLGHPQDAVRAKRCIIRGYL
jgi:hypothetical protein